MSTVEATYGITAQSPGASIEVLVIGLTVGLLIFKEVSTAVASRRAQIAGRVLDVVLVPLLLVYGALVVDRLLQGLS